MRQSKHRYLDWLSRFSASVDGSVSSASGRDGNRVIRDLIPSGGQFWLLLLGVVLFATGTGIALMDMTSSDDPSTAGVENATATPESTGVPASPTPTPGPTATASDGSGTPFQTSEPPPRTPTETTTSSTETTTEDRFALGLDGSQAFTTSDPDAFDAESGLVLANLVLGSLLLVRRSER